MQAYPIQNIIFLNLQEIVYIHQRIKDNYETSFMVGYTSLASALGESMFKYLLYESNDSLKLFGTASLVTSVETYQIMNMLLASIMRMICTNQCVIFKIISFYHWCLLQATLPHYWNTSKHEGVLSHLQKS